jgi:GAF domain-containing protein
MRGLRFLAPVIGLVLVASACGGSSGKKSDPAADLQVAKAAVLTKTDLPAGFDSAPYDPGSDLPDAAKLEFANCMNTKLSLFGDQPGEQKANSDTFTQDNIQIDNEVDVYTKKSTVNDSYNLMTKSEAPGCLQKLFTTALQTTLSQSTDTTDPSTAPQFGTVTVTKLDVSGAGDKVIGFRASVPVTAGGQSQTSYVDFLAATKDRAIITLTADNSGTPYDQASEVALLNKVAGRIGNQLS